jgi:Peptidase family M23
MSRRKFQTISPAPVPSRNQELLAGQARSSGSLRAKAGDRVRRGEMLARVGASGDAREPHLHFEVTTSSKLLAGEGVPYLLDRYSSKTASAGAQELHTRELPLDRSVVEFEGKPR